MVGPSLILRTDARPLKDVERKVRAALGKADTRELLDTLGSEVVATVMDRFRRGVTPEGGKWPITLREKQGDARPTLHNEGHLRDSYTYAVALSGDEVEVGSNLPYAAMHHFGGVVTAKTSKGLHFVVGGQHVRKQSVTIPARPALGLNDEDEASLLQTADDWLTSIIGDIR